MLPVSQESGSNSDVSDAERKPWKSVAAKVAGLAAALGCVACIVALVSEQAEVNISATGFFEGRELATVVGDQFMKLGHDTLRPDDREAVRDHVQASFKKISNSIKETNPSSARQLESLHLTREQQKSVLHVMGYVSDPRVQAFGRDIRMAARDALTAEGGGSRESLIRHLDVQLKAHQGDLRQLAQEIYPGKVADRWPSADHLHIVEAFDAWKKGSKEVLARSSTATGRLLSDGNQRSRIARIGDLKSLAHVVMKRFEEMHDGFEAPDVRKLQDGDALQACFQKMMDTMDPTCLFDSMSSSFDEFANEMQSSFESIGADPTPAPAPGIANPLMPAANTYTTPAPMPGGWR